MNKKIFTLIAASMMAVAASAQTVTVNKADGSKVVYQQSEITSIEFAPAATTPAEKIAGSYTGTDTMSVGGQWSYEAKDLKYVITANSDGTINLQIPEQTYTATMMGDITQGTYTVSNIAYDEATGSFSRNYSGDGLQAHVTTVNNGTKSMDSDYQLNEASLTITPSADGTSVVIANSYKFGHMPFALYATYKGNKE